jgi:predicted dehydrogenase
VRNLVLTTIVLLLAVGSSAVGQSSAPLRVGIVGLVHGHVNGFFEHSLHRPEIEIVGIAESDTQLASSYASRFNIDRGLLFSSLEDMLRKTHPQAMLAYTNTFDHRRVVEICAKYGVHVMMEKPLAVSYEDALAMQKAAQGKIHVLVNYETTWYRSNRAAYELLHQGSLGDVRKVVVHDGHQGPKEIGVQPEFLAWLNDPKLNGGGALFDFGCYGADLMTWLMDGQRPLTVTAITQRIKPEIYRVDDEATIVLTYPHAQAILQASWNWPFSRKDMEIYGSTGSVVTIGNDGLLVHVPSKDEERIAAGPLPAPYNDSLSLLRAVVLDNADPGPPSSLQTNLIITEILDAARRSATSGKTVTLAAQP